MKNVAFLLTPKSQVICLYDNMTLRQALEKMEYHRYSTVPILNHRGGYVGSITEGDLLWGIKNQYNLNLRDAEEVPLSEIRRKRDYQPINISANIDEVLRMATSQNFIPVVDDRDAFIGIIRRQDILQYFYKNRLKLAEPSAERESPAPPEGQR